MDTGNRKRRADEQFPATSWERSVERSWTATARCPQPAAGAAIDSYGSQSTRSEFHGQGIQHSGSGDFTVHGNVNIVQTSTEQDAKCLQDLRVTDPRDDKIRIEMTKGGLLEGSYRWIRDNADFLRWRRGDENSRLLWIKGDPGKGKTMLLCGIIDELSPSTRLTDPKADSLLSYFFCQATDSRINNATAVLRGLIYLLVKQQPLLVPHVQERYKDAGKDLFRGVNTWAALSDIFTNILQDPGLQNTSLIVDALDECLEGLPDLLRFIVEKSSAYPHVRWVVSCRNWPDIEAQLDRATQKIRLCLELNQDSVSAAVSTYIQHKVKYLAQLKGDDGPTWDAVQHHLSLHANDTFLWVALVCQQLEDCKVQKWHTLEKLQYFPPGLDALYGRMMIQIDDSADAVLYKQILAVIATVYRPITLPELTAFVDMPEGASNDESFPVFIRLCGSFLALRERTIYFVHQSAKDFLLRKPLSPEIFPQGTEKVHNAIFSRSLEAMTKSLRRDMYHLRRPGFPIEQVRIPIPDPLAAARYSCLYWVEHLVQSSAGVEYGHNIQDDSKVDLFLRQKYLYWLESLSLLNSTSEGVLSMSKLQHLLQEKPNAVQLSNFVRDAYRFLMYFKWCLENNPLQAYVSTLVFSPARSLTKGLFKEEEEPKWIAAKPGMEQDWSPCRQTLEGHSRYVNSVAFSPDGSFLASASNDKTVKLWDVATGQCRTTLKGHSGFVESVAFSPGGSLLASASWDFTVKLWDVATGQCRITLEGHSQSVRSVAFSPDGSLLASASGDRTVKLWDVATGQCRTMFEGHSQSVRSVAFSPYGSLLASLSEDGTVKLWDAAMGQCRTTLEGHHGAVGSVAFSPDGSLLASFSWDLTVNLWDVATGQCRTTLEGYGEHVESVAFSPDSSLFASASEDTVKLWDVATGQCRTTFKGHSQSVESVAFSPDGSLLASASNDKTVKLWDAATGQCRTTLEGHSRYVELVAFSPDSSLLVSASEDETVKLWDAATGQCRTTLNIGRSSDFSRTLDTLLFNGTDSCLHTDIGTILLEPSASNASSIPTLPQSPQQPCYRGYGVSPDGAWITWNSEKLLWLPPEYRAQRSAVAGSAVALGCSSGRVLIFRFSAEPSILW